MEEKNPLTTVAYSKIRSKELASISKKLGISKTQFIDAVIHQYYRTGDDPREPIKASLPKQLSKLENRLIGFIKTQDSEYLQEILQGLNKLVGIIQNQEISELKRAERERLEKFLNDMVRTELGIVPSQTKEDTWSSPTKPLNDRVNDLSGRIEELIKMSATNNNAFKIVWNQLTSFNEMKTKIQAAGGGLSGKVKVSDAIDIIDSYIKPIS